MLTTFFSDCPFWLPRSLIVDKTAKHICGIELGCGIVIPTKKESINNISNKTNIKFREISFMAPDTDITSKICTKYDELENWWTNYYKYIEKKVRNKNSLENYNLISDSDYNNSSDNYTDTNPEPHTKSINKSDNDNDNDDNYINKNYYQTIYKDYLENNEIEELNDKLNLNNEQDNQNVDEYDDEEDDNDNSNLEFLNNYGHSTKINLLMDDEIIFMLNSEEPYCNYTFDSDEISSKIRDRLDL
ncbi:MAG: hypothetical protein CBD11_00965 [Phycisphaera sp. TMED151]|nr:MAG: hypothetical protein CBD11_00965 [Phycisphaera sp. TMED151]